MRWWKHTVEIGVRGYTHTHAHTHTHRHTHTHTHTDTHTVEIGVRGFVAKSTTALLLDFGFRGRSLKGASKELSEAAEKASQWLWLRCSQTTWGHVNEPVLSEEVVERCLGA